MKKLIKKYQQNKLLTIILGLMIIFILLGFFYITILNNENKLLIKDNIENYLNCIKNNKITYEKDLFTIISSNFFTNIIIWLLGISLIGIPVIILIFLFKSFITSFTFISIIYNYGIKGLIFAAIYIIPLLINLFITFLLTYYALSFSYMLFKHLFKKNNYNLQSIVRRYLKIFIICLIFSFISSLLETFLIPFLIKLLYF